MNVLLVWLVLGQAPALETAPPADGSVIKPEEAGAPNATAPPAVTESPKAAPKKIPPPDARDATDAPRPAMVSPPVDGSITALEQDGPGLWGQAVSTAIPLTCCWAGPGALVAMAAGFGGVVAALLFNPLWPAVVLAPLVACPCLLPGCLVVGAASATVGTLVAQFFSGRRGPLLQSVGAGLLALIPAGAVMVLPVLLASAGLLVAGLLLLPSLLARASGEAVSPNQVAGLQAFTVVAVAHPILAAAWTLAAGAVGGLAAGFTAAFTFRWLGRHLEPGEDQSLDILDVDPPPAYVPQR